MRGPSYSIPSIDRRSGLGTYQPDLSQMPAPPAGYQYQVVPGNIFPQLVKLPNQMLPLEAILILGGAAFLAWHFLGKKKTISMPSL